jgi:hypothetical protein
VLQWAGEIQPVLLSEDEMKKLLTILFALALLAACTPTVAPTEPPTVEPTDPPTVEPTEPALPETTPIDAQIICGTVLVSEDIIQVDAVIQHGTAVTIHTLVKQWSNIPNACIDSYRIMLDQAALQPYRTAWGGYAEHTSAVGTLWNENKDYSVPTIAQWDVSGSNLLIQLNIFTWKDSWGAGGVNKYFPWTMGNGDYFEGTLVIP